MIAQQLDIFALTQPYHGLTFHPPFGDLFIERIKKYDTRKTSTKCPKRLVIQNASWQTVKQLSRKTRHRYEYLADKYLGRSYEPQYGVAIAICNLVLCLPMTPELIAMQSQQEIELGIWLPGRVAWYAEGFQRLSRPLAASGSQSTPWPISESLAAEINAAI